MSLIRAIFAFGNGREVANLGFVFTECLHSAFALGSLWVRSASTLASLPEAKKSTRQCGSRDKVQMLWHLRDRVGHVLRFAIATTHWVVASRLEETN